MLKPVSFYYMRHGQTEWNRIGRTQGQLDVDLNETGLAQARAAAGRLGSLGIATICSSPLKRALRTAEIQAEALGLPIEIVDELKECGLGEMEGRPRTDWFDDWRAGRYVPPGAETIDGFIARGLRAVNAALEHPGPVLIVAHGGIYWSIQRHAGIAATHGITNAVPVRHDPPDGAGGGWRCEAVIEAAEKTTIGTL
jgi:broad specificity phosphatase PhoE